MAVTLGIDLPAWVEVVTDRGRPYATDARMRFAIALAREKVQRRTGGPFGAAVFGEPSGALVGVGVNSVERLGNSVLHAEVLALMGAEARIGSWTLRAHGERSHVLVTSCDPCAMCLGAALWSGVGRIVCGADRDDAAVIGFEEGPVFPESWHFLAARGLTVTRGLLRDEARAVLDLYRTAGGTIYNG